MYELVLALLFDGIAYSRKRNTVLSTMKNCVQTRALGTFGGQLSHYFWRHGVGGVTTDDDCHR